MATDHFSSSPRSVFGQKTSNTLYSLYKLKLQVTKFQKVLHSVIINKAHNLNMLQGVKVG